jgi:hypothetical protein
MSFENKVLISRKALKELSSLPERDKGIIKDRIPKIAFFPLPIWTFRNLKVVPTSTALRLGSVGWSLSMAEGTCRKNSEGWKARERLLSGGHEARS